MIWTFQKLVVLLNNLEEEGGRNVDTFSDGMINPELGQMNLYLLFSFLSFEQFIYLYSNIAIGHRITITSFNSKSTDKARSSLYVELMLHDN